MKELEKLSKNKISSAKERTIEFLKEKIKNNNPQLYDQLLVSGEERKLYFFTDYSSESLSRIVKKYEFPLLSSVKSTFRNNFLQNKTGVQKINDNSIFNLIEDLGVSPVSDTTKNSEKLVYYNDIPLELDGDSVKPEQPYYYLPSDTITKTCDTCSGEKYTTCEEHECHGQHIYTCSDCNGEGETTCLRCGGRHEYECPSCHGKGNLKCNTCSGSGNEKCSSCNGRGYNVENGRDIRCKRCNGGYKTCSSCRGTGNRKCSSISGHGLLGAAIKKGFGNEYCGGKGRITCKKCKPNGKIDCETCETSGKITCTTCYGDHKDNRYGKVDCKTCKTAGELGVLTYIENKINYHSDTDHTCSISSIKTEKFSISNIKNFIGDIKQEKVYSNINKEDSSYDSFSTELCMEIETKLGLYKDQYPKLLKENIYYECVPCTTVTYKHILSGTEHQVSLIGIDTNNPEIIYHSDPTKVEIKKGIEKNVFKDLVGKAFSTKKYKEKIEMRNEIILMVYVAKADGEIEDSEKETLAKYITGLDDFTNKEKLELFALMSTDELPELTLDKAIFYSEESTNNAIKKLIELATKADGEFEETEKKKIEEIKVLIQQASKSKKGALANFFSTWQISLPIIIVMIAVILSTVWLLFFNDGNNQYDKEIVAPVSVGDIKEEVKEEKQEDIVIDEIQLDENLELQDDEILIDSVSVVKEVVEYYKINDPDGYSNLRDAPKGKVIQKVYEDEEFEVLGEYDGYKKVKLSDGTIGFIHKSRVVKK